MSEQRKTAPASKKSDKPVASGKQRPLLSVSETSPRQSAPAPRAAGSDFDRRTVVRELKDIVRMLDRSRAK